MSKTNLHEVAKALPGAWRSLVVGKAGGANIKVLRMDSAAYPDDVHVYAEALIVLEGRLNLQFAHELVTVGPGEVFVVPPGVAHAVAPGSHGTLVIIDADA